MNKTIKNNKSETTKVAICFWGLTRSLKYTIETIKKNIFEPLTKAGITYDIYLHTYHIDGKYSNPWAGENNEILDNEEYKLLKPDYFKVENQSYISKIINFEKYKTMVNPWAHDQTFNNSLLALWSLKEVTKLWSMRDIHYSKILYCRPDVEFLCPIDIGWILDKTNDIYLANFAIKGEKFGIGADRFAIGKPDTMKIYGNRFDEAYEYSKIKELYSRKFLEDVLKKYNRKIKFINFQFIRIRANGKRNKINTIYHKKSVCKTKKNRVPRTANL